MGKILMVDLSDQTMIPESIPDRVYEDYLSGMGLGAYILYNRMPAGADPLGPENILGFCSGFLTGTGSLFSGRWTLVGKSPLTGTWGDANCGGTFSPAIKHSGYDAIFFKGISPAPFTCTSKTAKQPLKTQPTSGGVMRLKQRNFSNSNTDRKQPSPSSALPVSSCPSFREYAATGAESPPVRDWARSWAPKS